MLSSQTINIGMVGSRNYYDEINVRLVVDAIPIAFWKKNFVIVSGGAKGVDSWAIDEAKELDLATMVLRAEWNRFGKGAGMIRNELLVNTCHLLFVFWDGSSPGTRHVMSHAKKTSTPYKLIGQL